MIFEDEKSPYVDYTYYKDTYHGSKITEAAFPNVELEAEAYVNAITFGRVLRMETVPSCVKNAICAAVDVMKEYEEGKQSAVKSESNDGYSISYGDPISEQEYLNKRKTKVRAHLANTGLTYKGWSKEYDDQ